MNNFMNFMIAIAAIAFSTSVFAQTDDETQDTLIDENKASIEHINSHLTGVQDGSQILTSENLNEYVDSLDGLDVTVVMEAETPKSYIDKQNAVAVAMGGLATTVPVGRDGNNRWAMSGAYANNNENGFALGIAHRRAFGKASELHLNFAVGGTSSASHDAHRLGAVFSW